MEKPTETATHSNRQSFTQTTNLENRAIACAISDATHMNYTSIYVVLRPELLLRLCSNAVRASIEIGKTLQPVYKRIVRKAVVPLPPTKSTQG